jgi:hypothetical protein
MSLLDHFEGATNHDGWNGDRPDAAAARARWRAEQPSLDRARLVFVDEAGTATNQNQNCIRGSTPNVKEGAARPLQQNRHGAAVSLHL